MGEGFLSYDDLSVIEPDDLMQMGELSQEQVDHIVEQAEKKAEEAEQAAADQRRRQKEQERLEQAAAAAEAEQAAEAGAVDDEAVEVEQAATGEGEAAEADHQELKPTVEEDIDSPGPADTEREVADAGVSPSAEGEPSEPARPVELSSSETLPDSTVNLAEDSPTDDVELGAGHLESSELSDDTEARQRT